MANHLCRGKKRIERRNGYSAEEWLPLCQMFPAPAFVTELLHLYRANKVSLGDKAPDHDEETEVIVMPIKEAWQKILKGEICDAKTIAGIAMLL